MLFLFFKSDDFTGTYVLLSESVDKSLAKYARGVMILKVLKNKVEIFHFYQYSYFW